MGIGRTSGEEDRVRMPRHREDRGAQRFLDMLRNPPGIFFFERADRDHTRSRSDSKLFLVGGPADLRRGAVDTEKDKCGLPTGRRQLPDEGVTICEALGCGFKTIAKYSRAPHTLRTRDDLARLRGDIHAGNSLVMPGKLILQREALSGASVQLHSRIASYGEARAIGIEGVVGDGLVEQKVDFWGGHDDEKTIGATLYYR
jgi:hypothetical protein